eukprot:TRINITY_DN1684_c0_g1_i2.p1 TRINITY_DN1684_c0_g1~~TRINITY_DN1684_c0_g1_i2.p1  ORF type:complete len:115 (-),score=7.69 TRINITY_DN1684_c0_g1_i2:80-424(-)
MNNTTLTSLLVQDKCKDHEMMYLTRLLKENTTITRLYIDRNEFTNTGVKELTDLLATNSTITELDIGSNDIGVEGVKHISEMVKTNTTLKILELGCCIFYSSSTILDCLVLQEY